MNNNQNHIYFDNAATSWPKPEKVYEAAEKYLRHPSGNPGRSGQALSLEGERFIYNAREKVASFFNISDPARIIFTLNATDALNIAIKGIIEPGDHVIYTAMEHNSVLRPLGNMQRNYGVTTTMIPCSHKGEPDLDFLDDSFQDNTRLVICNHASNVCGKIMPLPEIIEITRKNNAFILVDAAQTAGLIPIDATNVDLMAFSGHKGLLGPPGIGGLYVREGVSLKPFREGGTGSHSDRDQQPENMPERLEAGTLNTPGIAGLLEGINFIEDIGINNIRDHEINLTSHFLDGLKDITGINIFTPPDYYQNVAVISLLLESVDAGELGDILENTFGIICRTGLHCAPLAHQALGTYPEGTVRFSPGYFNTLEEVDYVINALSEIASLRKL